MALIKQRTLPSGVTVEYWRILQTNVQHDRDGVITLAAYVNQSVRETSHPLDFETFDLGREWLDGATQPGETVRTALLRAAYERVKQFAAEQDSPAAWFGDAADG